MVITLTHSHSYQYESQCLIEKTSAAFRFGISNIHLLRSSHEITLHGVAPRRSR